MQLCYPYNHSIISPPPSLYEWSVLVLIKRKHATVKGCQDDLHIHPSYNFTFSTYFTYFTLTFGIFLDVGIVVYFDMLLRVLLNRITAIAPP